MFCSKLAGDWTEFDSIFSKDNVIHTGAWCDECVDNYFIDVDFY